MSDLVGRKNVAVWDEHRNSSRVFQVPKGAADEALRALQQLRRSDPKLVAWIEDGHPLLTDDQHRRRFGEPYTRKGKR